MKYFLGKKVPGGYEAINCIEETDIMSLIDFTSQFNNESDLKDYLVSKGFIYGDESLAYVYKKKDVYHKLFNGDKLSFSNSKNYKNANDIYKLFISEKYNLDLFTYIYTDIEAKYHNLDKNIRERSTMRELFSEVNYANSMGISNYETTNDRRNINLLIFNFIRSYCGIYEREKRSYQVSNGKFDINKRKLVDLMLILNGYYNSRSKNDIKEQEEEKEEFLTDDDFIKNGEDPDNFRKLIREPNNR